MTIDQLSKRVERRIVCAALRSDDGDIICGPRHYDYVMRKQIRAEHVGKWTTAEQGFIDQRGNFLNRQEAFHIALTADQFKGPMTDTSTGILYSEHLY